MTVYVDDSRHQFGRMLMCHLIADTTDELRVMARAIGVAERWIQYPGTEKEHFDICRSKRALAVRAGAVGVSQRELGCMMIHRREEGRLCQPAIAERYAERLMKHKRQTESS
jgi:hypothetical protein